jgi:hypothetical protein
MFPKLFIFIFAFFTCVSALEVAWLIDESASVGGRNFRNIKKLIEETSKQIDARMGDNVSYSILEFGHRINPHRYWHNKDAYYKKLASIGADNSGATKLSNAFRATADRLFTHNKTQPRVIAVFSDGVPRPGGVYGGPQMVHQVHRCFNESGVDKLIYAYLNGTYGSAPPNPNVFNKVGLPYNQSEDMLSIPFKRPATAAKIDELRVKIIGPDDTGGPSVSPSERPTASPTEVPTTSPIEAPTASPAASPTASPTNVPTTSSPTFQPTAIIPDPTPEDDDQLCFKNSSFAWLIVGMVLLSIFTFLAGYMIAEKRTEARYDEMMRLEHEQTVNQLTENES